MNEEDLKNGYGFISHVIEEDNYVLGASALPAIELCPDGQWDDLLPEEEVQIKRGVETYNCTAYGTLNALEILFLKLFVERKNFSERYVGIMAGTKPYGNSPHVVIETIRKVSGVIDDSMLPFDEAIDNVEEYFSPSPMSFEYLNEGKKLLDRYSIGHEWVFTGGDLAHKQGQLKEALKYSPVGISVYAWNLGDDDIYVKPAGKNDNHWTVLYGYEEGKYWKIFDSYDHTHKKLAWDFDFGQAKRYHIEKKAPKPSWWSFIREYIRQIIL